MWAQHGPGPLGSLSSSCGCCDSEDMPWPRYGRCPPAVPQRVLAALVSGKLPTVPAGPGVPLAHSLSCGPQGPNQAWLHCHHGPLFLTPMALNSWQRTCLPSQLPLPAWEVGMISLHRWKLGGRVGVPPESHLHGCEPAPRESQFSHVPPGLCPAPSPSCVLGEGGVWSLHSGSICVCAYLWGTCTRESVNCVWVCARVWVHVRPCLTGAEVELPLWSPKPDSAS